MTIQTTVTDRKALAEQLSRLTGEPSRYLRNPTYAYQVGPYTINRDGSVSGDDLEPIREFLITHGYLQEAATPMASDAFEAHADSKAIGGMSVCIPLTEYTPSSLTCLLRTLYARQILINAMTRSDCISVDEELITRLKDEKPTSADQIQEIFRQEIDVGMVKGIDINDGKITMDFPFDEANPTQWQAYAELLLRIDKHSHNASRANTKKIIPADGEMKYFCYCWLIQLGMGGPEQKANRRILLDHLPGYAAFRNTEKMKAHVARIAQRRKPKKNLLDTMMVTVEEARPRE